jgi:DNA-directed RNA polymerase subunit K/omega
MNVKKKVQFDDYNKVIGSLSSVKISKPIMTKYEFNQIVSLRTNQLALGGQSFINIENYEIKSNMNFREIALEEMKQSKLPYIVKRVLPNGKNEYFKITDLDLTAVKHMMR